MEPGTNWIILKNHTIDALCGSYNYSSNVTYLKLASNNIHTLCLSFLNSLLSRGHHLKEVDLSDNLISTIPQNITDSMVSFRLANNPIDCNCDVVPWMPDWLENATFPSGEHMVPDYKDVICNDLIDGKQKRVYRLKEEDLGCNPFKIPIWFTAVLTLAAVLVIAIGISMFIIFRRWNEVKFWLYLHFDILDKSDRNENIDGKIFDALLSYR